MPWDFSGGSSDRANVFDTTAIDNGEHTITALVELSEGGTPEVSANFNVDNLVDEPPPTEPPAFELIVSTTNDRSDGVALEGETVSGDVYVFMLPESGAVSVVFSLNGEEQRREGLAPWDFAGGGDDTAFAFHTTTIDNGEHTITALVELSEGGTTEISAGFIVDNPAVEPSP